MVGLPFANTGSVELKERMRYVTTLPGASKTAGQELYEVRPKLQMRCRVKSLNRFAITTESLYESGQSVDR